MQIRWWSGGRSLKHWRLYTYYIVTKLLEVFVMPGVDTRLSSRTSAELLSAGENIVGFISGHHLLGPVNSHTLHIQLARVNLPLQPDQLTPEHVSLLDDLVGKLRALELSVKCKLVLRFSIGNFINPSLIQSYYYDDTETNH